MLQYGQVADGQWSPMRLQLVGKMLSEDRTLNVKRDAQRFAQRLEEKYRAVIIP